MSKYKYVAELERLLSFMSSWDRQAVISRYTAMFDEAEDVDVLIAKLGSPTKLAISLANDYVPTEPPAPEPEPEPEEAPQPESEPEDSPAPEPEEAVEGAVPDPEPCPEEPDGGSAPAPVPVPVPEAGTEPVAAETRRLAEGGRKVRPVALVFYILLSLLIGLPIAIVLIALGVPFIAVGVGTVAIAAWLVTSVIGCLTVISDILLILGAALVIMALGLLLSWLGVWISMELGYVWIGKAIFGLGGRLCFKEEGHWNG